MSYACGKQYYGCVTCMLWCSNTESVPLLVSNIHDIILVHTQYVLVCTVLYSYSFPVPVCTRYVLVRTSFKPVHTKYPVPVMSIQPPVLARGSTRLWIGWIQPAKRQTSIRRRLIMATRMMVPEMKFELDLYEYALVQT